MSESEYEKYKLQSEKYDLEIYTKNIESISQSLNRLPKDYKDAVDLFLFPSDGSVSLDIIKPDSEPTFTMSDRKSAQALLDDFKSKVDALMLKTQN